MANLNITNIPAPRVPFIDERTGLMAREWYRFFLNLFVLTGSGNNPVSLEELQLGPPNQPDLTELLIQINQNIAPQYEDQSGDFLATLDTAQLMSMMSRFETAESAIQGAYLQPVVQTGTIANYNLDGSPTAGGIVYGTGPALAVSAAGTTGQVLTSAGAGTPTWATAAAGTVTSVTGTAPVVSSGGTTPAISMPAATTLVNGYLTSTDWTTFNGKGSGTVTNVSFTGGIVSVATATTTPALTVAGTTGGVPYFSSASTWTTSATLGANFLVFGGGAGVAPSTPLGLGTGVQVLHGNATGNAVWGSVSLTADVSGTLPVANGGTGVITSTGTTSVVLSNGPTLVAPLLGTPASGVLTNCTGTATGLTAGNATTAVNTNGGYVTLGASKTLTLGSSSYVIAGSTYGFFINSSGDLANLYKFDNSGAVRWYNYGAGAITSDASGNLTSVSGEEYKIKDGVPKDPVRMLMNLKPEYYFWADTKRFNKQRQLGFFAQNVNKAIGEEAAPTPVENVWINEKGVESRNTPPWGYYDRSVLSVTVLALQKLITEFDAYKAAHP